MKNRDGRLDPPQAYLITFTCYGTRLPGNSFGWVNRRRNQHDTPFPETREGLANYCAKLMAQPRYELDQTRRGIVLDAIVEVCDRREWTARAIHIRQRHNHGVIESEADPDVIINAFKSRASFRLNQRGLDQTPDQTVVKRWTKGGSKRYLWTDEQVNRAIDYVLYEQGEPMEVYAAFREEAGTRKK